VSDQCPPSEPGPCQALSRRESLRQAAILALAASLGVPSEAFGRSEAVPRLVMKFYKDRLDGGQLVGTLDVADVITSFLGTAAGARASVKWYDTTATTASLGTATLSPDLTANIRLRLSTNPGD
jgi:hypothetical protein